MIKCITQKRANGIIDNRQEFGLFVVPQYYAKCMIFTAIDNSNGNAYCEEFTDLKNAIAYLYMRPCITKEGTVLYSDI